MDHGASACPGRRELKGDQPQRLCALQQLDADVGCMDAEVSLRGAMDLNADASAVDIDEDDVHLDVISFGDMGDGDGDSSLDSDDDEDDDDEDADCLGDGQWDPWQEALDASKNGKGAEVIVEDDGAWRDWEEKRLQADEDSRAMPLNKQLWPAGRRSYYYPPLIKSD